MSLVGGVAPPSPVGNEDFARILADIAKGGQAYADRLDAFQKARSEALEATARYGKGTSIDQTLADAGAKRKEAEDLLISAKRHADELVEAAQEKAKALSAAADAEVAIAKDRLAEVTRERQTTVKQLEDLQLEVEQVKAGGRAYNEGMRRDAQAIFEKAADTLVKAKADAEAAAKARKEVEAKMERINAALRG